MPGSSREAISSPLASRRFPSDLLPGKPSVDFPLVGTGASAGGLEACARLLDAMPDRGGMALILVQHLDPAHASLMVDLLKGHTSLTVLEATDGMAIEHGHLYVIPPARFLSVSGRAFRLKPTQAKRGARLPFDYLLQSMSQECGASAVCVVLSGTGADGSVGLLAVKQAGGFVITQEPTEAEYDGMPLSAIATGRVDAVLTLAEIPRAILNRQIRFEGKQDHPLQAQDRLAEIVELLRSRTPHDFTLYKPGTLRRRVERRMATAAIGRRKMEQYFTLLEKEKVELNQLAKDLLTQVTGFFRDPMVFDILTKSVAPGLVHDQQTNRTLRIWVAGCSTGEEAYSIAMVFQEHITAVNRNIRLQIFASDADEDAIAFAREGLYPNTIVGDVGSARLAAFFIKEDQGYRVIPDLRANVVFTVQDLLADPPFSRIDLVSCRNVMIYLGPKAQRKVISILHFALREGGVLLLGNAESVGDASDRFEVMSKPARLYRHICRTRPDDIDFTRSVSEAVPTTPGLVGNLPPSRQAALAEFCRRQALAVHAPATVLCNRKHECLFSLGPTERYLRMAPGYASLDVLAMVGEALRARLHSAILRSIRDGSPVTVGGGRTRHGGSDVPFAIEVHPVRHDGEDLLLLYFVDQPAMAQSKSIVDSDSPRLTLRVAELERDLETAQEELQVALRSMAISGDEHKATRENERSANEEFQSANEELLTSKEELQSLNEELTALNAQLQETLEQQRMASNDLQNVLYSTDVATLFLDFDLKIRFFTPATRSLFNIMKTDLGRPLEDLHSLAGDATLSVESRKVLETLSAIEHEIETADGVWCRRILPYRTHDNAVRGVVITFTDITQRRHAAEALEMARRDADLANAAKSRFLASASHDLRQPLQTLSLLQGLLASRAAGTSSEILVTRLEDTIGAMSSMLNTLLDINQIEAGAVRAEPACFPIGSLLARLKDAFCYQAQARGIGFHIIPCGLNVTSDPRLLEQILRNLVSNAIKYTKIGKVLLGCRRQAGMLRIEVWDTGIGIPDGQLRAVFEEYHQLDNAARERNRGLGLGLSIVQRLGVLLNHRIRVRSRTDKGSVFTIEVPISAGGSAVHLLVPVTSLSEIGSVRSAQRGTLRVLVVEDDPDVRELLTLILADEGYHADVASDGPAALRVAAAAQPDLLLTDYNLPGGMDGLSIARKIREELATDLPVIVVTGDISTKTCDVIAAENCLRLVKPVKPGELRKIVCDLLKAAPSAAPGTGRTVSPSPAHESHIIFIVDDDRNIRDLIRTVLENDGRTVRDFDSSESFLKAYRPGSDGCLLIDSYLPGMGGLELLQHLRAGGDPLPTIMITGSSDVAMAVAVMKAGAIDFIEKPIASPDLLAGIRRALEQSIDTSKLIEWQQSAEQHIGDLTPRQHQIMDLVLAGHPSKNIAADLGISQRTVENHRASIMKTTGTKSLPALARLALSANVSRERKTKVTSFSK